MTDPFANAPENDTQEDTTVPETNTTKTAERSADRGGEARVTGTFKGGAGFDAPWIVVHAETLEELEAQLDDRMKRVMEKVQKAGQFFASLGASKPATQRQGDSAQRPARQQAPANAPECPPGWEFKSGVSKAGKAWKGYFPPRGSDEKPMFF